MPPDLPKRQRKSSRERRIEIADAALRVIASKGIAAFTTDTLAREVEMTSGALFRHFSSKEAILEAAVARTEALLMETFPPPDLPPLERLEAFLRARTRLISSSAGLAQLLFSEQFMKALEEPARQRLQGMVHRSVRFLIDTVSEAQAARLVRTDLPPEDLARLILGMIVADILINQPHRDHETLFASSWRTLRSVLRP